MPKYKSPDGQVFDNISDAGLLHGCDPDQCDKKGIGEEKEHALVQHV